MVRTLKLDEEINKTIDKINTLQSYNFAKGLNRKETFELNLAQFKLKQLREIENSDDKYIPKEDEKRIKSAFMGDSVIHRKIKK